MAARAGAVRAAVAAPSAPPSNRRRALAWRSTGRKAEEVDSPPDRRQPERFLHHRRAFGEGRSYGAAGLAERDQRRLMTVGNLFRTSVSRWGRDEQDTASFSRIVDAIEPLR